MATDPRFVIVGSGRHGSGYIAAVLNSVGVDCGHEQWWNPLTDRTDGLEGDSSWCAVPDLERYRGVVLQQVRHPLGVISSLLKAPLWGPYRDLIVRAGIKGDSPVDEAIAVYLDLNEECARHALYRWKLEDINPMLVSRIGEVIGHPIAQVDAVAAVESTPTDTNHHGPGPLVTWAELEGNQRLGELKAMAVRYGYL